MSTKPLILSFDLQQTCRKGDRVSPGRQQIKQLTIHYDMEPALEYRVKFYRQYQVPHCKSQLYEVSQKYWPQSERSILTVERWSQSGLQFCTISATVLFMHCHAFPLPLGEKPATLKWHSWDQEKKVRRPVKFSPLQCFALPPPLSIQKHYDHSCTFDDTFKETSHNRKK